MSQLGRITANSLASLSQTQEHAGVLVEVTSAHPTPEEVVDALLAKLELSETDHAALRQGNGGRDIREQLIADLRKSGINSAALSYVGSGKYRGYVGLSKQMQQRLIEWSRTDGQAPAATTTSAKQQELQAQSALARHRAELALRTQEARRRIVADVLGAGGAQMAGAVMARHLPKAAPLLSEALPPLVLGTGLVASAAVTLDKGLELGVERQMEVIRHAPPMMSKEQDERPPVDTAQQQPSAPAVPTDEELPKGQLVPADEAPPATTAPQGKDEPSDTQPTTPQGEPPSFNPLRDIPPLVAGTATGIAAEEAMKPRGRLEIEPGRTLTPEERKIAALLVAENRYVLAKADNHVPHVRNPDFEVDGIATELKTVSNLTGKNLGGSLARRILEAKSQAATHAIIDVREQAGMTREVVENAAKRAYVVQTISGKVRLYEVRIIGKDFDVTVPYDPTR